MSIVLESCMQISDHVETRIQSNNCGKRSVCDGETHLCKCVVCKLLIYSHCKCILYISNTDIKGIVKIRVVIPKCRWGQTFCHILHCHEAVTALVRGLDQIWLGIIRFNTGWRNGAAVLLISYVLNVLYGATVGSNHYDDQCYPHLSISATYTGCQREVQ